MKSRVVFPIALSLMLLPGNLRLTLAQSNTNSSPVGKITEANVEVQLQRRGRSGFSQTSVGTDLYAGDLLKKQGGTVIVFCYANRQTWRVPDGVSGANHGCPPVVQPRSTLTGPIGPTRSPDSPDIISPRRTALLDPQPTFRWYPVLGAVDYTVRVRSTGGIGWQQEEVRDTKLNYPSDKPPLQLGNEYLFTVQANNSESVAQEVFTLLNPDEAQQVKAEIEQITSQNLPDEAETLVLVDDIYLRNNLIAQAIDELESFVKQGSQTPAIYRTLGVLYGQVGLLDLAEERYLQAVELAKIDLEGQAVAQAGLGFVYAAKGNLSDAVKLFNQARIGYETLGAEQQVREIEQQLQKLEAQLEATP